MIQELNVEPDDSLDPHHRGAMLGDRTAEVVENLNIRDGSGDALAHLGIGKPAEARSHVVPKVVDLARCRNRAGDRGMRNHEF